MSRFVVTELDLPDLKGLTRKRVGDHRGYISRIFSKEELMVIGWSKPIAQINHAYTAKRGTVRGMHYQVPPHSEMKLVSCIRGEVWDVAVDLRAGSKTFLQWHAEVLSADNATALLIPEGFAHGFQALSDDVELLYCHSAQYVPSSEAGLNPLDPLLAISWPLVVTDLSVRDSRQQMLDNKYSGIEL